LISIILKTGTKEKNVSDLALDILNKYSLSELKNITINNLIKIKGIGEVKAIELIASIELGKRIYLKDKTKKNNLTSPQQIYEYTKYLFNSKNQEYFYALYFNSKQQLLNTKLLFIGTINQSITHPREVFKEAYLLSASSIVCIHNHPSNDTTPSKADITFTKALFEVGKIQNIPIIDHIIVGDDNYYSFYEHKNILNL
jgi:DNA repair protein RadC